MEFSHRFVGMSFVERRLRGLLDAYASSHVNSLVRSGQKDRDHEFGSGGGFQTTLEVIHHGTAVLRIDIDSSYSTSSDDFFDYSNGDRLTLWCSDSEDDIRSLYDELVAQVLLEEALDRIRIEGETKALAPNGSAAVVLDRIGGLGLRAIARYVGGRAENISGSVTAALQRVRPDFDPPGESRIDAIVGEQVVRWIAERCS